uniref:Uncharacterized protein n=1 Tax=Leptobrachium leishanense TaxID=445787 RepID=A0A8C5M7T9_9ANUR
GQLHGRFEGFRGNVTHLPAKIYLVLQVDVYTVNVTVDIGDILSVRLYKEYHLASDDWFCKYVAVTSPGGETYRFPCYQWLIGEYLNKVLLCCVSGLMRVLALSSRWRCYGDGMPHCVDVENISDLQLKDRYSNYSAAKMYLSDTATYVCCEYNARRSVICYILLRQVESYRWKEDAFFGYQFLNGVNPVKIRKCFQTPENFPVDDEMVASSLGTSTSLQNEIQKGKVFFTDYKILQGLQTNTINGQKQYLAAPLCLLWKNPQDDIVPIAIQLGQTPGEDNPIFLPSDSEWDWTLAKMWVRNAEFHVHEDISHLLYTHQFAEVFYVATTRQLPMGHPVHKLLIHHFHYTLFINVLGRQALISPGGLFEQISSIGHEGAVMLIRRAMEELTYTSLCLPEDIASRAVESIPNYYYREDGMKIWLAIERFVSDIVHYYYEDDHTVSEDPELQAWVEEIYKEGFLENVKSGIPSSMETRVSLICYLTMVIFSCSVKHAAVNNGQFDFCTFMPNTPPSMRKPPPTDKGTTTFQSILETLPQINTTTRTIRAGRVLSNEPVDGRLGHYPEEHFTEDVPKKFIQDFQRELAEISRQIKERNEGRSLTYLYLDPENIENSVAI